MSLKRDTDISGDRNASQIARLLDEVRALTFTDPDDIWLHWLRFTEALIRTTREVDRSKGGTIRLEEQPRMAALEAEIAPRYREHWAEVAPIFSKAALLLLERSGNREWDDVLGVLHMTWVRGWTERGQYFSPWDVGQVQAQLALFPMDSLSGPERLLLHLHDAWTLAGLPVDALDIVLATGDDELIYAFLAELLPRWQGYYAPITLADESGCGSGGLLLTGLSVFPSWATRLQMVRVYGIDLDPLCVQMTRLNLLRYGQWAEGIVCGNTLAAKDHYAHLRPARPEGAAQEEEEDDPHASLWELLQRKDAA